MHDDEDVTRKTFHNPSTSSATFITTTMPQISTARISVILLLILLDSNKAGDCLVIPFPSKCPRATWSWSARRS